MISFVSKCFKKEKSELMKEQTFLEIYLMYQVI